MKPQCSNCLRREEDCQYEVQPTNALVWQTFQNYPEPHHNRLPSHWDVQQCSDFEFFLEHSQPRSCDAPRDSVGIRCLAHIWSILSISRNQSPLQIVTDPFDRLFGEYLLQLSFSHPLVSELVCLYATQQRNLLEVRQYDIREACLTTYVKSVSIVRRLLMTENDNGILAAAPLILFAFERTVTIFSPTKDGQCHINAALKLIEQVDNHAVVEQYLRPLSQLISVMTQFFRANGRQTSPNNLEATSIHMPSAFMSCNEAREVFCDTFRMHTKCPCSPKTHWTPACPAFRHKYRVFKAWSERARAYYLLVRGHNFREAKLTFVLLMQYQLMEFCLERSVTL